MSGNLNHDELFLNRLREIVEANLNNPQFSVSELASEYGKSRSYIYLRLKSIAGESISQFIKRIRLKKAIVLLEQDRLTVAEIAYDVGFGSPSYFIKCFHNQYGYSPGDHLKYVKETNKKLKNVISPTENSIKQQFYKRLKWQVLAMVGLLLVFAFLANRYYSKKSGKANIEKTIAVLPFKNLSNDADNKYFADGIMDDILSHLAHIEDFTIRSRTSTEKYRDSEKSLSLIAKELGVSYLVEGSVQKYNNRVKLIIQLNDYNDQHIWSDSFDREFADIFELQSEISKQIALELETVLSPNEIEQIEKRYTENAKAYDLYLQGRFYHRLRTKESFTKSLEYHNKALEIDSNYCLAYAGLADVYVTSTYFRNYTKDEGISRSRAYALKALSIDKNLAEAHAALGAIAIYFDYDWAIAEERLKLAMKIDPHYSRAYHLYAQYLTVIGKEQEVRKYINTALELNPQDRQLNWFSYYLFYREDNYNKALEFSDKIYFIDHNERGHLMRNFLIYLRQDNILKATEEYKKFLSLVAPEVAPEMLDSIYAEKGKHGFVRLVIDLELQRKVSPIRIATYYAIINEKDSAMTCLESAFEIGYGNIARVVSQKDFYILHSEPRFNELLSKMNLRGKQ